MKYCIFMPTTIKVSETSSLYRKKQLENNEKRLVQYTEGIKRVLELNKNIDIVISDNSDFFKNNDHSLKDLVKNIKVINDAPNKYGGKNKGSGVIENWLHSKELLKNYDYIIHFEPRQLLNNNNFINKFLENPRNLFNINKQGDHFNTGILCIKSNLLLQFISEYSPEKLIKERLGLEYALYNFMKKHQYDIVNLMDLLWYDSYKQKTVNW